MPFTCSRKDFRHGASLGVSGWEVLAIVRCNVRVRPCRRRMGRRRAMIAIGDGSSLLL
jgi:hypothetical protein